MEKTKVTLLNYLAEAAEKHLPLPSIPEIGRQIGISTSSLREQLEVARQLGVVEIRPKTGMSLRDFSLTPVLMLGLDYSQKVDPLTFEQLSDLRKNLESSYWHEAAPLLNRDEIGQLEALVVQANGKIAHSPIQVPKEEHRSFHLGIFQHLNNRFVFSIMESYWALYQSSDLNIYMDQTYLELVWNYHQKIIDALKSRDFTRGHEALLNHMDLVKQIKKPELKQRFE
ncbi:MAG TPA: FCD domain-containing protein [Anaerolineaceae bacterium]|nr:FCD domain-containing protein [Anaerolineaceae bacterium]